MFCKLNLFKLIQFLILSKIEYLLVKHSNIQYSGYNSLYMFENYFDRGLACRYAGINPYDTCIVSSTSKVNNSHYPYCQAIDFSGSNMGHEDFCCCCWLLCMKDMNILTILSHI